MHFDAFALHAQVLAGVRDAGYTTPTPIQSQAIPAILTGGDVIGLAQTGTGKTAAFVLPVLHRMLERGARKEGAIRTLVLAPTRELAIQINHDITTLGRKSGFRSAPVIGGVGQHGQVKALRRAAICVACPGRLLDLMQQGVADMSQVDTLVLDEADTMLDMGFLPAIKQILARLPKQRNGSGESASRQTLLFSATMPPQIRTLAESLMQSPQTVQVANTAPAGSVMHSVHPVPEGEKGAVLEAMLRDAMDNAGSVIVFTRTKHRAKSLALKLCKRDLAAVALQGNLSQNKRQEAMDGFKRGKYRILVATDIAARGIDCASVSHVINYDPPDTAEAYTHRIGRTGRAQRSGVAVTLMSAGERRLMKDIERALQCTIERYDGPGADGELACIPNAGIAGIEPEEARFGKGATQQPQRTQQARRSRHSSNEERNPEEKRRTHPAQQELPGGGQRRPKRRHHPRPQSQSKGQGQPAAM